MAATATQTRERRTKDASSIQSGKRLLDTARLCDFLSISDDTLKKLIDDPAARFPTDVGILQGKRHWTLKSIEDWVERKERDAKAADRR